ncbi:NhaP-type Na+/H+ and K+/H+ antiporter [Alcanivorax hongdengensis A-11-3]|uniref:NhaP-type Na+/H+ and K+/H+ antiporter n=1 Tax=Alcanivorax hongdengensis A-11-3 TaxID=1177179 RepID=L0WE41_9GAMM|nr:sodium:proton antiporter [Alcanivorax hongdengensis]EKF74075.1 NhaP-type Na+/H+ and K+/H+ antiporter [Alcanivorax hongdengensis A-11-3]
MELSVPFQLAIIVVVAFVCQWASWRIKLPAILPLLLTGLALGPLFGVLDPKTLFGDLLLPGVSLAVAIILFEGAMTLHFDEIRGLEKTVRRLVSWGALITWVVVTVSAWWLLKIPFGLALLFGALVVVTGPTVIVPLLRSVRPVSSVARLLRWEGIVIDPLGAILAVLAYEFVVVSGRDDALLHSLWMFFRTIGVGTLIGTGVAFALAELLRRHLVPEYLRSFLVLSVVIGEFVLANGLGEESGLVAVTATGIVLANRKGVRTDDILHFKENLSVMLISGLFIVLAARLQMDQLSKIGMIALAVLAIIQFVARPLSVWISTIGSSLNWREKALLSWIAPRGIVAAAISALFAERLHQNGVEGAEMLVPLTFMVIIGTVALQSLTARPLARLLKVAEPAPRGFLIVGANPVARAIGQALQKSDCPVMVTDSSWESIRAARMEGLGTFYGNPVSQYADQYLDLVGYGKLLGLSPRRELNTMATMRYRLEFGEQNIFSLAAQKPEKEGKHEVAPEHRGATLFAGDMTYARLASLLSQGAEIRKTRLTEEFDFQAYRETPGRQVWPLFALDSRERVQVFTAEDQPEPRAGWHVIGLIKEEKAKEEARVEARAEAAAEKVAAEKNGEGKSKKADKGDNK